MNFKGTAGPWMMSHSPIAKTEKSNVLNPVFYLNVKDRNSIGGRIIAKVMAKDTEELKANAKLITAGPDMLNMLVACKEFIKTHMHYPGEGMIDKIQQVIDKATT